MGHKRKRTVAGIQDVHSQEISFYSLLSQILDERQSRITRYFDAACRLYAQFQTWPWTNRGQSVERQIQGAWNDLSRAWNGLSRAWTGAPEFSINFIFSATAKLRIPSSKKWQQFEFQSGHSWWHKNSITYSFKSIILWSFFRSFVCLGLLVATDRVLDIYFDIFPGILCDGLTQRAAESWRARDRQSDGVNNRISRASRRWFLADEAGRTRRRRAYMKSRDLCLAGVKQSDWHSNLQMCSQKSPGICCTTHVVHWPCLIRILGADGVESVAQVAKMKFQRLTS